jgi:hypothetical protein
MLPFEKLTGWVIFQESLQNLNMARDLLSCARHLFIRNLTRGKVLKISDPEILLD